MSSPRDHGFEDLADHLGAAYLRYSFTKGTEQEVAFLVDALGLQPGMRVLDVGCGPGRHAHALGRRGIEVHGIDISERFVELARADAPAGVTFERLDARSLPFDGGFDAAISLCQGAFGLADWGPQVVDADGRTLDPDLDVLDGIARALEPGGAAAVTAFSAYFQVRHVEAMGSEFHVDRGVNHERTTIKDEQGVDADADLWTTCFTPRELRLLAHRVGLRADHIWSVSPGRYGRDQPGLDSEEFLLVARKV
ncbi:class I SAM-dependent methyltransferase [Aquihabitans sp. McL0605]|uniref:class I SAM-dependent methyltransferase n=1 Tax=Aquihabitans sp. McL0605 TaxID=3415671 RepID=UPI003CF56DC0